MKSRMELNHEAVSLRREFGVDAYSPINVFALVHHIEDLTTVFYPMSSRISGICIRDGRNKIIGINSASTLGRQRFTMAHELHHLYFDDEFDSIVCLMDLEINKSPKEKEADIFASYFLAPYEALDYFVRRRLGKGKQELEVDDVVRIEQYFGMSRQAILWRLVGEGYLSLERAEPMKTGIVASARRLGYDDRLYKPTAEDKQYGTYGKYVRLAEEVRARELVSIGKYEELLLDGFRADLIYGLDAEGEEKYD